MLCESEHKKSKVMRRGYVESYTKSVWGDKYQADRWTEVMSTLNGVSSSSPEGVIKKNHERN
jgi:hypothetical protein